LYGDGDIAEVSLLKLIYKYVTYVADQDGLRRLDSMVSTLQMANNDICMPILNGSFSPEFGGDDSSNDPDSGVVTNNAPTITGTNSVDITLDIHTFVKSDFTIGFTDTDGDSAGNIVIKTLPANGTLKYNGIDVVANQSLSDISLLTYTKNSTLAYNSTFAWTVYDDNQAPLQSNIATFTLDVQAESNAPATIGDGAIYKDNRIGTVFTLEDFTTNLAPPYNDPEGDPFDAVRIDEVSNANEGVYYFNGLEVSEGQIITAAQLDDGLFVHVPADNDDQKTDSFTFSCRDAGSQIWVQ
jgi:hypothetical protein